LTLWVKPVAMRVSYGSSVTFMIYYWKLSVGSWKFVPCSLFFVCWLGCRPPRFVARRAGYPVV